MEWVELEVHARTVELAVKAALDDLGLASPDQLKVEVVQEPKPGFLGLGGREAIIKASPAPKKKRRRRNKRGNSKQKQGSDGSSQGQPKQQKKNSKQGGQQKKSDGKRQKRSSSNKPRQEQKVTEATTDRSNERRDDRPDPAPIEEQAEVAKGFIEGLLGAFGLEGTVTTRIDDGVLYLDVSGEQTEALVGPKGSVMSSVLELTRTVVQRKTYGAPRMRLDVAGYAERRREALKIYAGKLAEQVREGRHEIMLEPMNAADRKVVHDAVAELDDVRSFSEGEEPRRAVVLAYDGDFDAAPTAAQEATEEEAAEEQTD